MKNQYRALLDRGARAGIAQDALEKLTVNVTVEDGQVHSPSGWCESVERLRGRRNVLRAAAPSRDVDLKALSALEVCEKCSYPLQSALQSGRGPGSAPAQVLAHLDDAATARSGARLVAKGSAGSAQGRVEKVRTEVRNAARLAEERYQRGLPALLLDVESALRDELSRVQDALDALAGGEEQRTQLGERIQAELLPQHLHGRLELDATPALCVIVSHRAHSRKVAEVVDAHTLRKEGGDVLLYAPRYVLDWLQRNYAAGGTWGRTALVSTPADVERSVAETAAALWDPQGDGALRDLRAALEAAEKV